MSRTLYLNCNANKIKSLRQRAGMTQGQLAYSLGVKQPAIAKYEKRGVQSVWILQKLAEIFECNIQELY